MANLTLPSVIVEEILAMLPIKSIHRFRQLSKSWSSLLVSSEFQKLRTNNSTPPETNLEKILQCSAVNGGYVIESLGCLGDGEDPVRLQFPTDKFVWFWGSCNGLVCVTVPDFQSGVVEIVVWNPFTGIYRKLQDIDHDRRICACGFGYDSVADDYKVFVITKPVPDGAKVKIFSFLKKKKKKKVNVEIFSLRTGSWKVVEITSPGSYVEPIAEKHEVGLFVNGALHWQVLIGGERKIIAFDLAKEKFYGVPLPAVEKELCDILRFKELGVAGDYLCLCFVSKSDNITIVGLMKEYCKSWVHFIGYNSLGYARTYSCQDFVPQAGKDGGYVILHFPGGQHVLKWDNLHEETDESGGFSLNIKSSEFRMTIAYTEALTSPYASP
ncbi:hypothetical protein Tsubulata_043068 [Turnera subulata]|uniref:F-box domain-containing protein n=1 Tax=Turnera subulata TaxID=218843 RepID=A0A9Q0J4X2_9ROSI|nr:hypothetical protein Tsubulata_043068 [Turnera subulata]